MSGGKRFWRSLEEYQQSDAFGEMLKAEFPSLFELWTVDRRQVLRVMGASLALAGMSACKPVRSDDVVPFVNRPEGVLNGRTDHYATAVFFDGFAQPVLATTSAGRPIKLDGNPQHPAFRGGSTPFMQAAILDLYDPDRSQEPLMSDRPASWADFDGQMVNWRAAWRANGGAGLRILVGPTTSPTLLRQVAELKSAFPQARVHLFDPLAGNDGALRPKFDAAQVVVSLDDDWLGPGPSQAINGRLWGERHGNLDTSQRMRLFMAETTPTQTGAKADRRIGVPPSRLAMIARALTVGGQVTLTDAEIAWAKEARAALEAARGRSLLTVGRHAPAEVHALALQANQALGNVGKTGELAPALGYVPAAGESFLDLVRDIEARRVAALFVLGANPVYQAPGDIPFAALYAKVPLRVHAGLHVDETAAMSSWHLPIHHALEDWSDGRSPDGTAAIVQPVVRPMYDSRSLHEIVAALTQDEAPSARDLVRQTWAPQLGNDAAWAQALKLGFIAMPATAAAAAPAMANAVTEATAPKDGEVEIVIRPDPTIHDGSFANNGWLQELPKPLFKTTWENVIAISPRLAAQMQVDSGDVVRVESGGRAGRHPLSRLWPEARWPNRHRHRLRRLPDAQRRFAVELRRHGESDGRKGEARNHAGAAPDGRRGGGAGPHGHARAPLGAAQRRRDRPGVLLSQMATGEAGLGHGHRPRSLHRLQRLCRRLPGREQCARGRKEAGLRRSRDALAAGRSLLCRLPGRSRDPFRACAVHALRAGAVRDGLPGACYRAQPRRPQPDGLQPLHRDADLLELLPIQGAALQLVRLHHRCAATDRSAAQPRRHCARPRRHGKMHLLHPAHRGRDGAGRHREPRHPRRRSDDRMPAGVPCRSDHVRRSRRPAKRRREAAPQSAQLRSAR
jgi:MoCo/4Fe-4S cofactor protein with predicted Tat translocation signal